MKTFTALRQGFWRRGLLTSVAILSVAGIASVRAETYRLVGVDDGETAHLRSRPSSHGRPVGFIPADARGIQLVGRCQRVWCQVRYGEKVGWVSRGLLEAETSEAGQQVMSASGAVGAADPGAARGGSSADRVENPFAGPLTPSEALAVLSPGPKTYVIAGLTSGALLEMREAPSDDARVVGSAPFDAAGLEDLGQSVKKWRHIRYQGMSGWVLGRHIAESDAGGRRFRVTGVSLMEDAPVREYPDAEAAAVGGLPSHASGVVAIGACDAKWCHVRYLGMVGWVERRFLEPVIEQRG